MKLYRFTSVLLCVGLVAVGCSRQDDTVASSANPLLAHVPADTPYVFANLEPVPSTTLEAWEARLEPMLGQMQSHLDEWARDLESGHASVDPEFAAVARAILAELDGKLSVAGLASLGIDTQAMSAVYGNGLFPVVRLGLSNAQALRDAIARVETNSGHAIPEHQHDGQAYWKVVNTEEGIAAYIAILDDHVAFSAAPLAAEPGFLPAFLGQALPAESLADSGALPRLNREQGFLPHGSGYMDMSRVTEELLTADSTTATYLALVGDYDPAAIEPVCAAEARLIAAVAPRMVAGVTELTPNTVGVRYQVEFERGLARELAGLVADVPVASADAGYVMSAALGIKVGSLREWLLEKANAMTAQPFACPKMADFNHKVARAAAQLNQPMPPFIGNLKGFRAVLEEFNPVNPEPESARGMVSLEVKSPQMLIGMASMLVPGFEQLDMQPGGDPVRIPEELMTVVTPRFEAYAVMTSDAIGLSLGKGMRDGLAAFMEDDTDNDGVFLSVEYDMAALAELQDHGRRHAGEAVREQVSLDADALASAYRAMLGRSRIELSFQDSGLVIDSRMTFK